MEGDYGIVSGKEAQLRIVVRAFLTIESLESIEPAIRAFAGSDADLQNIDFRRQKILATSIFRSCSQNSITESAIAWIVAVRMSARQSLLIPFARRIFPNRQMFPECLLNVQMMLDRIGVNSSR